MPATEIDARQRQQDLSAHVGWGAGVNPILVSEDIQNMRRYLAHDDFPHPPDTCFPLLRNTPQHKIFTTESTEDTETTTDMIKILS